MFRSFYPSLPTSTGRALLLALALAPLSAFAAPEGAADDPYFEPILPLVPQTARSETEEDRITAAALFTHGRMLFQRGKHEQAIQRYQRAWRYDPSATAILDEIWPLAFELKRNELGFRYAVLAFEQNPRDPLRMRRLGAYLTEQGEWARALGIYEKSLALEDQPDGDAGVFLLRFEMGRLYFLVRRYDKSAESFAIALDGIDNPKKYSLSEEFAKQLLDKPDRAYSLIGESFLKAGRLDESEEMFRRADKAKSDAPLLAYHLARVEAQRGNTKPALNQLNKYLAAKQASAGIEPYQLLAELLEKQIDDKSKAARRLLARLAKLHADDPSNSALAYFLAQRQADAGQLDEAAASFAKLLELQESIDVYQGLIDVQRQRENVDALLDNLAAAVVKVGSLSPLEEAAEQVTTDAKLVERIIARTRARKEKDELKPGMALAAAYVALAGEKNDAADEFIELALAESEPPAGQVMVSWGLELFMSDRAERAVKFFRRVIDEKKLQGNEAAVYFYLAGALAVAEQTDQALEAAGQASKLNKDSARFQSRRAWILYNAKQYDRADEAYRQLLAKLDDDFESGETRDVLREARLVLSNISVHQKQLDQAEEWLEQVLDEFPEDIGALNDLGYLWADRGVHLHRSLEMTQKAVAAEPDNKAYRDSLGWAFYRLGRFDEAVKELEAAVKDEGADGVILDHLGDAYLKADQQEKAIATWRRAAKSFEESADAEMLTKTRAKITKYSPK